MATEWSVTARRADDPVLASCRICLSQARRRKRAVVGVCRLPFFPSLRLKAQASSRNLVHWTKFNPARSHLAFHEPTQGLNQPRHAQGRYAHACPRDHHAIPARRILTRPMKWHAWEFGGGRTPSNKSSAPKCVTPDGRGPSGGLVTTLIGCPDGWRHRA